MINIPSDATGDALRRFLQSGFDLNRPMDIDFFIAVPSQEAGEKIAVQVKILGFQAKVEVDSETGEWTCYASKMMMADHVEITKTEMVLSDLAKPYGGYCDGFGSFGNNAQP